MADSQNMPYTNAAILEIQRIRPVAPLAVPHRTTEETSLDGFTIPTQTSKWSYIVFEHDPLQSTGIQTTDRGRAFAAESTQQSRS